MEISTVLKNIFIPTLFVIAGIFLVVLSIVPRGDGKIQLSSKQKIAATAVGIILLLFGTSLYLSPTAYGGSRRAGAPTIMGVTIRKSLEAGNLVFNERINFYDEDGNTQRVERELVELSDPSQREFIQIPDSVVTDPPEVQKIRSSTIATWQCNGRVYIATVEVTLVDTDGNRSEPVRFTIDCN
jgi:hypothetical protein